MAVSAEGWLPGAARSTVSPSWMRTSRKSLSSSLPFGRPLAVILKLSSSVRTERFPALPLFHTPPPPRPRPARTPPPPPPPPPDTRRQIVQRFHHVFLICSGYMPKSHETQY